MRRKTGNLATGCPPVHSNGTDVLTRVRSWPLPIHCLRQTPHGERYPRIRLLRLGPTSHDADSTSMRDRRLPHPLPTPSIQPTQQHLPPMDRSRRFLERNAGREYTQSVNHHGKSCQTTTNKKDHANGILSLSRAVYTSSAKALGPPAFRHYHRPTRHSCRCARVRTGSELGKSCGSTQHASDSRCAPVGCELLFCGVNASPFGSVSY
jgi:hypothetical protein